MFGGSEVMLLVKREDELVWGCLRGCCCFCCCCCCGCHCCYCYCCHCCCCVVVFIVVVVIVVVEVPSSSQKLCCMWSCSVHLSKASWSSLLMVTSSFPNLFLSLLQPPLSLESSFSSFEYCGGEGGSHQVQRWQESKALNYKAS